MKSYLSLIPISAKVRKRQNRMMILCIIISVLLVTTIFSAADMIIRGETVTMQAKHGNWHIQILLLFHCRTGSGWRFFLSFCHRELPQDGRLLLVFGCKNTALRNLGGMFRFGLFQSFNRIAR